jgi:CheY-like chemotaxis protein
MNNPTKINRILLVDDDQDDCELFGEAVNEFAENIHLICLNKSEEILHYASEKDPDLIFMDVNMPRKNGYQCLEDLKSDPDHGHIPVIMYSNTGRPEDIHNAYEKGAVLFLRKPSTYKGLVEALQNIICREWSSPADITAQYYQNGRYQPFG